MKLRKIALVFSIISILIGVFVNQGFEILYPVNSIQSTTHHMTVEPGDEISDIHFYNPGDKPPTKPYMSIFFKNLSPSDWENVEKWHKEMIEKLREMGRVHTKGDYEKITPVVTEYSAKFITTQADCIAIEFPKEKTGILLVNEKKVEK